LQLGFYIVDFLLPAFLGLFAITLELIYLVLYLGYHLYGYYIIIWTFFSFLFALLYSHLHLFYSALFCNVLLVIFT